MKTLVYINSENGLGKAQFEAVTYAKKIGSEVLVITSGTGSNLEKLGEYGASKVLVDRSLTNADAQQLTRLIANAKEATGAEIIVFSHDFCSSSFFCICNQTLLEQKSLFFHTI